MKYHIPQIPYNIAIPNTGGSNPPPSRLLPQHLRAAVTSGLCRLQSVDTPTAASDPWSEPDPLAEREDQLIGTLLAKLESRSPGKHTSRQLIIQALQYHLNNGGTANQPTTRTPAGDAHPVGDTIAAGVAHIVRPLGTTPAVETDAST